jgi:hypothetical protein
MPEVLLSTDDLTILGGPAEVNLQVDFGSTGDRGSQIFVNTGKPIITLVNSEYVTALAPSAQVMDLYINVLSADSEYQYVYQLQSTGISSPPVQWTKLFKLVSNIYSHNTNSVVDLFVDGDLTVDIELTKIVPSELIGSLDASNFNVQHTILGTNPIASSVTVAPIQTIDDILKLRLIIHGVEFVDGNWVNLSGQKTVHLFITVV